MPSASAAPGHREAAAIYQQTVLGALEEASDAFVAYREQQRLVKLNDQSRESARAASIARARHREGIADFIALLDAERTQWHAEEAVARAESEVFHRRSSGLQGAGRDPAVTVPLQGRGRHRRKT